MNKKSKVLSKIYMSLIELGEAETCYPNDIFSLSAMIAQVRDHGTLLEIVEDFGLNKNAFVRRCVLTAIRFSFEYDREVISKFEKYIKMMLDDENGWVVYDACWLVGMDDGVFKRNECRLKILAGKLTKLSADELDKFSPVESEEYAMKMAAETLARHGRN